MAKKTENNFRNNMIKWALKWVSERAFPIIEHIDELEKDKTLVDVVNEWAEYYSRHELERERVLKRLMEADEYDWYKDDIESARKDYDDGWAGRDAASYSEVINFILTKTHKLY